MVNKDNKAILSAVFLMPNMITIAGACAGLTSIKHTFNGIWESALFFIIFAVIADGMDGRIARLLKSPTDFGANLDSLADSLSFGVAPAFLLYFWKLQNLKIFGWLSITTFVVCMLGRLARFNTDKNSDDKVSNNFYTGVPAPSAGLLLVIPVMISVADHHIWPYSLIVNHMSNEAVACYTIFVSFLAISRIPTFKLRSIQVPTKIIPLLIMLFSIFIMLLISKPWITLPIIGLGYILLLPVSSVLYYREIRNSR